MRRAPWLLATLALAAAACGSGGGPTVSAQPASTSSGGPAAVPVGPPQRGDRRAREIKRVTLVDAAGKNAEVEAFVSRLLSDAGERELFALSDARLSGASLGMLAAEPHGPAAQRFQASWPSDAYLSVSVADCYIKTTRFVTPDTTPDGYRIERVHIDYDATCPATLKLADAEDGHVLAAVEVTGRAKYKGDSESGETPAEEEAARDAASRAVKKLRAQLGR